VYSGSDWMPQDRSINALATNRGLVVRYPVRMKEDLLPYTKIPPTETRQLLSKELARQGCPDAEALAARVTSEQLALEGTFLLHSRTAAKNGGDYDFEPMDAEDLTAPILPSERRYRLDDPDVGRSARLDMQKALDLAVRSRDRVR